MPSVAGFYVSHEDCREWPKTYSPEDYAAPQGYGRGIAKIAIEELVKKCTRRRVVKYLFMPPPGIYHDTRNNVPKDGLMILLNASSRKQYIPPRPRSLDVKGKALLKQHLNLDVSDWIVLYYDKNDGWRRSTVIEPGSSEEP